MKNVCPVVKERSEQKSAPKEILAKKDWRIFCPPHYDIHIKKGESIAHVPEKFRNTLKTEKVI